MADRNGNFVVSGVGTLTFGEDFAVQDEETNTFRMQKLFRSNSVGWKDGRNPKYKIIKDVYYLFTATTTTQSTIEAYFEGVRDDYLSESGTLNIDGSPVTGTWTLVDVSAPRIGATEMSDKWMAEVDYRFCLP